MNERDIAKRKQELQADVRVTYRAADGTRHARTYTVKAGHTQGDRAIAALHADVPDAVALKTRVVCTAWGYA